MSRLITMGMLALGLTLGAFRAQAAESLFCEEAMTAAAAGTNAAASGVFRLFLDQEAFTARIEITHNVPEATSISIRPGSPGQTSGTVITDFNGATAGPVNYTLSESELQALINASFVYYVIVANATFPAPQGAIRVDSATCNEATPEAETEGEGEDPLPEGFADYECAFTMNAAQVPGGSGSSATASGTIKIERLEGQLVGRILIFHNAVDATFLYLHKGAPGEEGTRVRAVSSVNPSVIFTALTAAELEDVTQEPHYFLIETASGPIRGDLIGCAFDDGVEDPEGEGEGGAEGSADGEGQGDCTVFPDEREDLLCTVELSGSNVAPPTASAFTGSLQLSGPLAELGGQYLLVVRHNVENPTLMSLTIGQPGQAGAEPFRVYSDNLGCPVIRFLSPSIFTVLDNNPVYIEISSADPTATIRGDFLCAPQTEGSIDGEGGSEGSAEGSTEGGTEGELPTCAGVANALLLLWSLGADTNNNGVLELAEAVAAVPSLTAQAYAELNTDASLGLSTAELHRCAGPVRLHNADTNGNKVLSLAELLRVIQLYNAGSYFCRFPAGAEDGFVPGSGSTDCPPHASDYVGGADFVINLTELLRTIQLFNYGNIVYCDGGSEDNFCIAN